VTQEIEFKLLVTGEVSRDQLIEIAQAAGFEAGERGRRIQIDDYLDTKSGRLMLAGLGLRLRRLDDSAVLCIKEAPIRRGDLHQRDEVEARWCGDSPPDRIADLPASLASRTRAIPDTSRLQTTMKLETLREWCLLASGETRAELCLDRVRVPDTDTFTEIEIEWLAGPSEPLEYLVRDIRAAVPVQTSEIDKYRRALTMSRQEQPR